MLPLGTSAVTVGFGFLVAFEHAAARPRRRRALLVPIAHAVVAIPFVVRAVVPALRSIDPRLRDAATMLGASPRRVWREVDLPIVARAFAVAAGFCAAVSLGEFGATLFIARPDWPTVPIAIQRFLARPGEINVDQALAMSVDPDGADRRRSCSRSSGCACATSGSSRCCSVEGAVVRFGGRRRASTASTSTSATARRSRCSARADAGKTTLLRAVAGLQPLDGGAIALGRRRPRRRRRRTSGASG